MGDGPAAHGAIGIMWDTRYLLFGRRHTDLRAHLLVRIRETRHEG